MRPLVLGVLLVACSSGSGSGKVAPQPQPQPQPQPRPQPSAMTLDQSGIVGAWLDRKADPCTDFYQFTCGGFLATAQIPPDRSSWGAIAIVTKESEDFLHDVLEKAPPTDKLGAYYTACMDEAAIETAGIAPIVPLLDMIEKTGSSAAVAKLHAEGVFPMFALGPQQDFGDATKVILALDQSGLGLPDRKYYLESTGTLAATRASYGLHVKRMFELLAAARKGIDATAAMRDVLRIETAIAKVQQDEVTRRDPHSVYHRVDREGLERKVAPKFPWADYFTALGLPAVKEISVNSPSYFSAIDQLLVKEPPKAMKHYLIWMVLHANADLLTKAWQEEDFKLEQLLEGTEQMPPRWRRCVERTDTDLGELLAQAYVAAKFAGDSKQRAIDLTKSVLGAMRVQLDNLSWMDAPTRAAAKTKLEKMAYLVGFPDAWRSYDFEVGKAFAGNVDAAEKWELARQLKKIGKPVDRFDWQMTPPTVNAYYDPGLNEIALPAGQLQAPFFGATFHPAVNFGSTGGGTIGHEMTHGFDDEGSQFDGSGNLRDWWSAATKEKFEVATKCVVDQYAQYEAVPGVKLDGKLTAGENIADIGGVKLAFQAYQAWKTSAKSPPPAKVDGFTDDQLYFMGYGQSWCDKRTPQSLENGAHSNPHSPPMWRVNGVIVNQPGFAAAFGCKAGAKMSPSKACAVW